MFNLGIDPINVIRNCARGRFPTLRPPPFRRSLESRLLWHFLDRVGRLHSVIEFGSGHSTILFSRIAGRVVSFETDAEWIKKLAPFFDKNRGRVSLNTTLVHVDVGPTSEWGYPTSEVSEQMGERFRRAFDEWSDSASRGGPTIALIDGRWRVLSFLLLDDFFIRNELVGSIYFDDFRSRPHYHAVGLERQWRYIGRTAVFDYPPPKEVGTCLPLLRDAELLSRALGDAR